MESDNTENAEGTGAAAERIKTTRPKRFTPSARITSFPGTLGEPDEEGKRQLQSSLATTPVTRKAAQQITGHEMQPPEMEEAYKDERVAWKDEHRMWTDKEQRTPSTYNEPLTGEQRTYRQTITTNRTSQEKETDKEDYKIASYRDTYRRSSGIYLNKD